MERLTLPKTAIKSVAHFSQVSLQMLFRYPTVRAGYHCFGIGNQSVRPRQQLHGIFRIFENSPMMCDLQLLGSHLITSPPIRSYLGDQWSNLIFRDAQPSQQIFYGVRRCIIGYKGMSKSRSFFSRAVYPSRNCNDHQGFPFCPSSSFARNCRPKERFIHLHQTGQPIMSVPVRHAFTDFVGHHPDSFVILDLQFPLHLGNRNPGLGSSHAIYQPKPFQQRGLGLVEYGSSNG